MIPAGLCSESEVLISSPAEGSLGEPMRTKEFSTGPCGSKFAVASDESHKIIKAYDAALVVKPDMADRVSYVITPDFKVLYVYDSLNPDQHVTNTLAAIKAWKQNTPK